MLDPFMRILNVINDWSDDERIPISTLLDVSGIRGVRIFDKRRNKLNGLLEHLFPLLDDDKIFMDVQRVRGGTLLAFSRKALSESEIKAMLESIGEHTVMSFIDRMNAAMHGKLDPKPIAAEKKPIIAAPDFNAQAIKINEAQYKSATDGMTRSNQTSLQRNTHGVKLTYAGKPKRRKSESTVESNSTKRLANKIFEALEGMATADGLQPQDILQKFGAALRQVGITLGGAPIQDRLKELGIKAKTSSDGSEVILYLINAKTQAPQPIARISAESISNPSDFQKALQDMLDLAEGNEPGATESERSKMQAREKAIRTVSQSYAPPTTNSGNAGAAQAASPKPQM
jgi:hypothetical protein